MTVIACAYNSVRFCAVRGLATLLLGGSLLNMKVLIVVTNSGTGRDSELWLSNYLEVCICNIWAVVYGLCNYLDDNGRTLLLQYYT